MGGGDPPLRREGGLNRRADRYADQNREKHQAMLTRRATFAATAGLLATPAFAQTAAWPTRTIRLIVPFTPAGTTDIVARILAQRLSERLGQTVIIENRPGAGGNVGSDYVAKIDPDGYTFLMCTISSGAINYSLYGSRMPYKPDDFIDVGLMTQVPNLIFVTNDLPVRTLAELVAYAKKNPGKLNYGSSGVGNPLHLTMEMLKHATGIELVSVPFRGDLQINTALLAGEVEVAVVPMGTSVPHIKEGILRAIGVTGAHRNPTLPDVPTIIEQGVPGFVVSGWQGWFVPGGTPAPIVDRIRREVAKMLAQPDMQERIRGFGNEVVGSTPAEFAAYYKAEIVKYTKVIEDAKIPKQ
jgi:tripartite-type tricarboxylate transporter receptor subunit TctC